jgi:AcrR family transcriptional regulator
MNARQKTERARLSTQDWEHGALELIAEQGVGALAVEALARRLGVTKGSFYWHFRNREALLHAALERWEEHDEAVVLAQIEPIWRLPAVAPGPGHAATQSRGIRCLCRARGVDADSLTLPIRRYAARSMSG